MQHGQQYTAAVGSSGVYAGPPLVSHYTHHLSAASLGIPTGAQPLTPFSQPAVVVAAAAPFWAHSEAGHAAPSSGHPGAAVSSAGMGAATAERYVRQPTTGQYVAQPPDPAAFTFPMHGASPMAAAPFLSAAAPGGVYPGGPIPPPWTVDQPVQFMTPSAAPINAAVPLPLHTWTGHYPFRNVQFPTPYQGEGWHTQGRSAYGAPLPMRVEWEHSPSMPGLGEAYAHTSSMHATDGGHAADGMHVGWMPRLGEAHAHTSSERAADGGNAADIMRAGSASRLGEARVHTLSARAADG